MPTAASSTETGATAPTRPPRRPRGSAYSRGRRAVVDTGILLAFRARTARRPKAALVGGLAFLVVTVLAAVVPSLARGAGASQRSLDLSLVLPSALAGFLALAVVSAAASGGGRELAAREPAAVLPISPITDHLGALLLAPLNVAWLLQFWALLGATGYAVGPHRLASAEVIVVLWVLASTAAAQVLAWTLEGVRRVPHGIVGVRLLTVVVLGITLGLQAADKLATFFDHIPTQRLVVAMVRPPDTSWVLIVLMLAAATLGFAALGAVPASIASHRLARDEQRQESGHHAARRMPGSDLGMLVRIDRASVWRAVPMRRGVAVLALGPGAVAVLGNIDWASMTILPGLVASGGALLYGVNAWCLDSRGALWRESLPAAPGSVFTARAYVLGEFLLAASLVTVLVAGLRAGVPAPREATALVCTLLVVTVQVVGAAMRWSAKRPFAVDLRSARATPAPPGMMVAYSSRLALSTTLTGLVFSGLARVGDPPLSLAVAVPFVVWSATRLFWARRAWIDPHRRARIVTTVAVA